MAEYSQTTGSWLDDEIAWLETRLARVREDTEAAAWAARVAEVWIDHTAAEVLLDDPEQYLRVQRATREVADVMGEQLQRRVMESIELTGRLEALRREAVRYQDN